MDDENFVGNLPHGNQMGHCCIVVGGKGSSQSNNYPS